MSGAIEAKCDECQDPVVVKTRDTWSRYLVLGAKLRGISMSWEVGKDRTTNLSKVVRV